ncbi:MAG: transposase [Nitrospira sp.]|nr:transposase [Nitrospira sp.]MDH5320770.1 transposase [Nitrospira sp.]
MARPLRLEFSGALYHLTARGNAQQPIFLDETDRQRFLHLLGREVLQQHWRCYVYCLMDNHYHVVLETPEPNLSRGLRRLHGTYTQWFNRRHHRVGHVLQGRFKSLLVEKERYLQELCRYVVLNPVRAGLVSTAAAWPWSSYRATMGSQHTPEWLDRQAVLSLFDAHPATACRAYQRFVAEGWSHPSPWKEVTGQIFLGGSEFLARIERLLRGKPLQNVSRAQRAPTRLSAAAVLQRVAAAYQLPQARVLDRSHREAYQTAVYLLRRVANEPLQTVAVRFGISPSRVSKIQTAIETTPRTPAQARVLATCALTH